LTGIHQRTAPTKINRTDWNDLVTFLGGTSDDPQVDATKILLAQGGSLLSTWRYATDLTKMDAAKVAGNILAAQMQTNVSAAITAAGGITLSQHPTVPSCCAHHSTGQTLANATFTNIQFDSEIWDNDTMHDVSTNNERITFKTAGLYLVEAHIAYAINATGMRALIMYHGAIPVISVGPLASSWPSDYSPVSFATIVKAAVNEYVYMKGYQSSGGNLDIVHAADYSPYFSACWLSASP